MLLATTAASCKGPALRHSDARVFANDSALQEESRALTTGALDALQLAPTNPPTDLAKTFLKRDQQIEGLPAKRIDVEAILAGHVEALRDITNRLEKIDTLLDERTKLKVENDKLRDQLVEMGKKYEEERNRTIFKRIFASLGIAGTLAALIAVMVLCPVAIPIIGNILGFVVGKLPQLAGVIGVVSTKAFDGVVKGVENFRSHNTEHVAALESKLSGAMDYSHKQLVKARKAVIN